MMTDNMNLKKDRKLKVELNRTKPINVLVVEDDIDSAILVDSLFRNLGCQTTCAVDPFEAKKFMVNHKADIIILDWQLGNNIMADDLLFYSIKTLNKFSNSQYNPDAHKIKIVSYSSLPAGAIYVPKSPYYVHVDHWQKPINRFELIRRTTELLQSVDNNKIGGGK